MLKPTVLYKEELERKFAEQLYTEDYYLYTGYGHCNSLPSIKAEDNVYQYAIISGSGSVIGYFSYDVDPQNDCAKNFGYYSFDKGNITVAKDVFGKMEELVANFRRVEWRMIGGNRVEKHYDKFCFSHGGSKVVLHDVCKDAYGRYRDVCIYEIVRVEEGKQSRVVEVERNKRGD